MTFAERLQALKDEGRIGNFEVPQPNRGLGGGMLPWVIMPAQFGPATTYYKEADLEEAIRVLEVFGETILTGQR